MEIKAQFEENLKLCGVKENQTIVLGVSGGADSVTMLDLFLKSEMKLNLIVAHMNHGLRVEADKDEKLVKFIADKNNLEFVSKKITPPKNGNLEEELRIKRREFLLEVSESTKAQFVALAHNANDQAETFFLNTLRGSGPAGLGAMRMSDANLIRPLLNFERTEIVEYAEANHLAWHEDETNDDTRFKRNYLRHKVFPLLSEVNPSWLEAIFRTTHLQREIDDYLKSEAEKYLAEPFDVNNIQGLKRPVLFEVLGLLYEKAKGDRKDLTLQNLSDLEALISSTAGTKSLALPGNIAATRRYNHLDFMLKLKYNNYSSVVLDKLGVGENIFSNWKIIAERIEISEFRANSRYSIAVDPETLPKLKVRNWKTGDRISPFGMNGSKKLQDLFVDAKIDKDKRNNWPIFQLGKEIIWVPRLALSRNFVLKKSPTIKLTIEETI